MDKMIDFGKEDIQAQKFVTKYCATQEMDAANVQLAMRRGFGTIPTVVGKTFDEPIAVVGSGPSLAQTWEELKSFKKIIACNGAHDYLIERGIVPTWGMATDPREEVAFYWQKPHKDVQYLIASCCHPAVFNALEGHDVRLWHVFQPDATFPRGHWAVLGGSCVGLRALFMARTLGYTKIHVFGMDCSGTGRPAAIQTEETPRQQFHVNAHPNDPKKKSVVIAKIGDMEFETSEVFLEYARQYFTETMQVPDAVFTLHGDGLLQRLAEQKLADPMYEGKRKLDQQRLLGKGKKHSTIAVLSQEMISPEYAALNKKLHEERPDFGIGGSKYADTVTKLRESTKSQSVLDYGCGKGMLARSLKFPIWEYDPAIAGKDAPPRPADLVICTDVLEHIEPDFLDSVLGDLARCTRKLGYYVIHTGPSAKTLADGRNAHLIQQDETWWREKLGGFFEVGSIQRRKNVELHVVVVPKGTATSKPSPAAAAPKTAAISGPLKVVIGGTRKDRIPALVTEWLLRKNATCPIEMIQTWDKKLPVRPCPTGFSYVRFQVPALAGYQGRALYLDSDMLPYGDVAELAALDMGAHKVMRPMNQTAVLLIDCDLVKWDIEDLFRELDEKRVTYSDLMWKLWPLNKFDIGFLGDEWNLTDEWREGGKLLHYTRVATQPWIFDQHPLGDRWWKALAGAMKDGIVTDGILEEDVQLGHVKPAALEAGRRIA